MCWRNLANLKHSLLFLSNLFYECVARSYCKFEFLVGCATYSRMCSILVFSWKSFENQMKNRRLNVENSLKCLPISIFSRTLYKHYANSKIISYDIQPFYDINKQVNQMFVAALMKK